MLQKHGTRLTEQKKPKSTLNETNSFIQMYIIIGKTLMHFLTAGTMNLDYSVIRS